VTTHFSLRACIEEACLTRSLIRSAPERLPLHAASAFFAALVCVWAGPAPAGAAHPSEQPNAPASGTGPAQRFEDCNGNEIPDDEDIAEGTSQDCQPNSIPDECELDGPPQTAAYPTTANLRIPPLGTAGLTTHDVELPDSGTLLDLHVTINILHTYDQDLRISLSHESVTVLLSDSNGQWYDNYLETTFDDDAETPISEGEPPFTGSFQPEEPLAGFDGLDRAGIWTLIVEDQLTGNTGTLLDWTLETTTEGIADLYDCQPNGIPDECDVAQGTSADVNGNDIPDECEDLRPIPALSAGGLTLLGLLLLAAGTIYILRRHSISEGVSHQARA